MDKQPCITDQLWLGYSNKTLSQPETDMILNHAATCEVCADIKEGIDAMSQPATLGNAVSSINKKVDDYLEPKRKLGVFWYWSAAAVLVLGIGLSWYFINDKSPIAIKQKDAPTPANQTEEKPLVTNPEKPTITYTEPKEIPLARNDKFDAKPNSVMVEDVNQGEADGRSGQVVESLSKTLETITMPDTTTYAITPAKDTIPRGIVLAFENRTSMDDSYSAPPAAESMDKDAKKTELEEVVVVETKAAKKRNVTVSKRKATSMPAPANNSNVNNGGASNTDFKFTTPNDSANFVAAKSYYSQNKFTKCIETLKPITTNPYSPYYEEGLLIKAQSLIKLKKTKEAKTVLKTIISLNGEFKSVAEGLLKGLK